jgi:hypothetical protein
MSAVATSGLVILSYTISVAVNLGGQHGKFHQCASRASCVFLWKPFERLGGRVEVEEYTD